MRAPAPPPAAPPMSAVLEPAGVVTPFEADGELPPPAMEELPVEDAECELPFDGPGEVVVPALPLMLPTMLAPLTLTLTIVLTITVGVVVVGATLGLITGTEAVRGPIVFVLTAAGHAPVE